MHIKKYVKKGSHFGEVFFYNLHNNLKKFSLVNSYRILVIFIVRCINTY